MIRWNRPLSLREKILILVFTLLCLTALYLYVVHIPVTTRLRILAAEQQEAEAEAEQMRLRRDAILTLERELSEILALPPEKRQEVPLYDNLPALTAAMDRCFAGIHPQLSFEPVRVPEDGPVLRQVRFSVLTVGYGEAKACLSALLQTGFYSRMDSLTLNWEETGLQVTGSMTFWERKGEP